MSKTYVGITIGPIFDTILDATGPASLWFASSIFSDITKRLCAAIINESEFREVKIYSPYFTKEDCFVSQEGCVVPKPSTDGIGKYHDRIIFSADNADKEKLDTIINSVKVGTMSRMPKDIPGSEDFFKSYLQIHYCMVDENEVKKKGNGISALSCYLDALELMKTFPPGNISNPFMDLFAGKEKEGTPNRKIKESFLFKEIEAEINQLKNNDKIRSIEEIASVGKEGNEKLKYLNYFAIVSADGDKMREFLKTLKDEDISLFSKYCIDYVKEAVRMIGAFGGMTIYGGGDDLLFLSPVVGADKETVFELCAKINDKFQNMFQSEFEDMLKERHDIISPSISFGISIQYRKYPLYEAHRNSCNLLGEAKGETKSVNGRNRQAIMLQKHSGQTIKLFVKNDRVGNRENDGNGLMRFLLLNDKQKKDNMNNSDNTERAINSALYTLRNFRKYIEVLIGRTIGDEPAFKKGWNNLFDNPDQKSSESYFTSLAEASYNEIINKSGIEAIDVKEGEVDSKIDTIISILQLEKFLREEGSEK